MVDFEEKIKVREKLAVTIIYTCQCVYFKLWYIFNSHRISWSKKQQLWPIPKRIMQIQILGRQILGDNYIISYGQLKWVKHIWWSHTKKISKLISNIWYKNYFSEIIRKQKRKKKEIKYNFEDPD